jgi:hypothetical protein
MAMIEITKDDERMMKSCFTYGTTDLENQYLAPIVERLGEKIVKDYLKYLDSAYEVKYNVYEDHEGCTYNELVEKEH